MKMFSFKKLACAVLSAALIIGNMVACSGSGNASDGDKISVVTTIFPEYDYVREIAKGADNIDVTMLLDNGVDLHSFQPTVDDIAKISVCDVFIYVGGESDGWVDDALSEAVNKDMVVINLLEVLGDSVKEEEMVEGMEGHDHEHEHEHEEGEEHEHEEGEEHDHEEGEEHEHEHEHEEGEVEYDEHVWLSLKSTKVICQAIEKALEKVDSENAKLYSDNLTAYTNKLDKLDKEYESAVASAKVNTILFGDRFPFRYMVDDYGLSYYAAFVGCSAESEASFETITFLAGKVDELGLTTILQIESADGKIANTIKENTKTKDQEILTLDSMQSVTSEDVKNGATYLGIMEENLKVLKKALGL
ncbi:MAG: metal ABC transporter substrate-binding protein [Lachnospiraceae bacterium]|nr:metal ABC transporter substrate-binding protein [Lachnospiraceae bacterium]